MTATFSQEIAGLIPRECLSIAQRDEMFQLLAQHFDGVVRDQFEEDLTEKNWVIEIRRDHRLLGFSTLLVREAEFDGNELSVIYSGDTIVAPEAWGTPTLARTWISAVNYLRASFGQRPCYWLLLTSGFRTYRFLPVFWREFYPRHGTTMPLRVRQLRDHLAQSHYGKQFDAASGIVRFPRPQRLREHLNPLPSGRIHDADIAYFLANNPSHANGDELVCLTRIHEDNLTSAGRRMVTRNAP